MPFKDRLDAGCKLAAVLTKYKDRQPVVLALPRGGVPVAAEVAVALNAPLDLILVRKIGVPFQPELAMGAVVDGGAPIVVRNEDVIRLAGIGEQDFKAVCEQELAEIERRRQRYLGSRERVDIAGRAVIVIDDGIATGATTRAALRATRMRNPKTLVLAVPVRPRRILPPCAKRPTTSFAWRTTPPSERSVTIIQISVRSRIRRLPISLRAFRRGRRERRGSLRPERTRHTHRLGRISNLRKYSFFECNPVVIWLLDLSIALVSSAGISFFDLYRLLLQRVRRLIDAFVIGVMSWSLLRTRVALLAGFRQWHASLHANLASDSKPHGRKLLRLVERNLVSDSRCPQHSVRRPSG